jgi:hypothetical protein
MGTPASPSRLAQLVRRLPRPLLEMLDAWSYGVAVRRAERRRIAAAIRRGRMRQTAPT